MSRAFTLIETVVTTALFAVLMLAITQLYIMYGRIVTFQQSAIGVSLGGSRIIDAVHATGLQAKNVIATRTFSGVAHNSGATEVVFEIPSIDASGAIISGSYDYVCIYSAGTDVYKIVEAAAGSTRVSETKRLSDVVDELNFTYDNASFPLVTSVSVNATTSATVRGELTQVHLRDHIYLRNI